jgi:hypothetical protein
MTNNFEDVLRRMLATPPTPQKEKHKKSELVEDLKGEELRSGDRVPHSGIYLATHNNDHAKPHEVTCTVGDNFPECNECGAVTFALVQAAQLVTKNKYFKE